MDVGRSMDWNELDELWKTVVPEGPKLGTHRTPKRQKLSSKDSTASIYKSRKPAAKKRTRKREFSSDDDKFVPGQPVPSVHMAEPGLPRLGTPLQVADLETESIPGQASISGGSQSRPETERWDSSTLMEKKMLLPYIDKLTYIETEIQRRQADLEAEEISEPLRPKSSQSDAMRSARAEVQAHSVREVCHILPARYPRLWTAFGMDRAVQGLIPQLRSLHWLLHFIEEVYDASHSQDEGQQHQHPKKTSLKARKNREKLEREFLYYDGQCVLGGSGQTDDDHGQANQLEAPATPLPVLVTRFMQQRYGKTQLAAQILLDLLVTLEHFRSDDNGVEDVDSQCWEAGLFNLFLREFYGVDVLEFFLHAREVTQKSFGLNLSNLKTRVVLAAVKAKGQGKTLHRRSGDVLLRPHPLLTDGTLQACLSVSALEVIAHSLVMPGVVLQEHGESTQASELSRTQSQRKRRFNTAQRLAEYMVQELIPKHRLGAYVEVPLSAHESAKQRGVRGTRVTVKGLPVHQWLHVLVGHFHQAPEDIATQAKSGADPFGGRLAMIEKMQASLKDDSRIAALSEKVTAERREVQKLSTDLLRSKRRLEVVSATLERDPTCEQGEELATEQGELSTKLMLGEGELSRRKTQLKEIKKEVKSIERRREELWNEILSSGPEQPDDPRKQRERSLFGGESTSRRVAASLRCLAMWTGRSMERHQVAKRIAGKLGKEWRQDLDELRERSVLTIQRAYRKRKADREANAIAHAELERRRAKMRELEEKEELIRRKARAKIQAESESQMARARAVMREKMQAAEASRERTRKVRRQAASLECDRRYQLKLKGLKAEVFQAIAQLVEAKHLSEVLMQRFLMRVVLEWREATLYLKRCAVAATKIQARYRTRLERRRVQRMADMMADANNRSAMFLRRLILQCCLRVLHAWHRRTVLELTVRQRGRSAVLRSLGERLERWCEHLRQIKQAKRSTAIRVQAIVRGAKGRRRARAQRHRFLAASRIQALARGRFARRDTQELRMIRDQLDGKIAVMLGRGGKHLLRAVLVAWHGRCVIEVKAMRMGRRLNSKLVRRVYRHWRIFVGLMKQEHGIELERQGRFAVKIQRMWRGHAGRRRAALVRRDWMAALMVQKHWRRFKATEFFRFLQYRSLQATHIQAVFRGFRARRALGRLRTSDILRAAEANLYDRLLWYFDNWRNVAAEADEHGNNALHRAASGAAKRTLKLCLARGLDPNLYNSQGKTALHLCISSSKLARDDVSVYLMDHGSYMEAPDYDGDTPLLLAARLGRARLCGELLQREASLDVRDQRGSTALQLAVVHGHVGAVHALLTHGASPDEAGADGITPLHEAVGRGSMEITAALLEAGGVPDPQDDDGYTPLMYAAHADQGALATLVLEWGGSIDCCDLYGRTALHVAASSASVDVMQRLLDADADVLAKDSEGDCPLHSAVRAAAERQREARALRELAEENDKQAKHAERRAKKVALEAKESILLVTREAEELAALAVVRRKKKKDDDGLTDQQRQIVTSHRERELECREEALQLRGDAHASITDAERAEALAQASLDAVRLLLSNAALVTAQNNEGDQAAHLAARLGDLETMKLLIEYEAPFGRRNWAELTPIGVARMHKQTRVVEYLMQTLAPEALGLFEGPHEESGVLARPPWDLAVSSSADPWEMAFSEEEQQYYWINRDTGEMSFTAPHAAAKDVAKLRDTRPERSFKAQVQVEVGESLMGAQQYRDYYQQEMREIEEMRQRWQSAITTQRYWRRRMARDELKHLRLERNAARTIQRFIRWKLHDIHTRQNELERISAITIQRYYRGHYSRWFFHTFLYEKLYERRQQLEFAKMVKRLWIGYKFRRHVRKVRAKFEHGEHPSYEQWQEMIEASKPPKRRFMIYQEYVLAGTQDVTFYAHEITRACEWEQPERWEEDDLRLAKEHMETVKLGFTMDEKRTAVCLQRLWRSRAMRTNFKLVMRGYRLMKGGEDEYMNNPDSPVTVANFALFRHVLQHDYDHARLLYAQCMRFMEWRGPDNAFVLYSYAIFCAVNMEDDWDNIDSYVYRADQANFKSLEDRRPIRYNLARSGYYRLATAVNNDGESWYNYAMCLQLAFKEYDLAERAYIEAVLRSPHDERIIDNFNRFLRVCKHEDPLAGRDAYSILREEEMRKAFEKTSKTNQRLRELSAPEAHRAASRIQLWWRALKLRGAAKANASEVRQALVSQGLAQWVWEEMETVEGRKYWYNNETGLSTWDQPVDLTELMEPTSSANELVLANEWEICDDGEGHRFYFNVETGTSQWETPRNDHSDETSEVHHDQQIVEVSTEEWEECKDTEGQVFYYNTVTGESTWTRPVSLCALQTSKQIIVVDSEEWEINEDEQGRVFFYNTTTGVSQWNRPDGSNRPESPKSLKEVQQFSAEAIENYDAWEQVEDDDGAKFWYNTETGESAWAKPAP